MTADLIARLEAATEGRRELDAEIARNLGWRENRNIPNVWIDPTFAGLRELPHYTTNMQNTLSLVGADDLWRVTHLININHLFERPAGEPETVYEAGVGPLVEQGEIDGEDWRPTPWFTGKSFATPALALCIAALKARSAS